MTRLGCEVGLPSYLLCDQGSNIMKALREAEVSLKNLQLQLFQEKGIKFEVCSVGGHNEHGLVERVIRTLQESLEEAGLKSRKLTATGLQTLCKLVENDYNNIPLGFKFDRDQDNTETLKMITPNMCRLGRINTRALSGPLRLPHGASDMVDRVRKTYEAWFKIWSDSYIPKLMFRPRWYKDDEDLHLGDMVYFQKSDSEHDDAWIVGVVAGIDRGRDGKIRKVKVSYRNAAEDFDRESVRSVRKLVKLWSEADWNLQDDLGELARRLNGVVGEAVILGSVHNAFLGLCSTGSQTADVDSSSSLCEADGCCCYSHCKLRHSPGVPLRQFMALTLRSSSACSLSPCLPFFTVDYQDVPDAPQEKFPTDNLSDFLLNFGLP